MLASSTRFDSSGNVEESYTLQPLNDVSHCLPARSTVLHKELGWRIVLNGRILADLLQFAARRNSRNLGAKVAISRTNLPAASRAMP